MKTTIAILLILLSCNVLAQNVNEDIYAIMDENAAKLFQTSKAYSVSIGIVKDGKT